MSESRTYISEGERMSEERLDILRQMNPIGWIGYQEGKLVSFLQNFQQVNQFLDATNPTGCVVPLYTHPMREITDEEILALWVKKNNLNGAKDILDFARDLLKKASEK